MRGKQIIILVFISSLWLGGSTSCSRCYECTEQVEVEDGNGVVIDTIETVESVCTANEREIEDREKNGATCF